VFKEAKETDADAEKMRMSISYPKFSGIGDVKNWLELLEDIFEANGEPKKNWAILTVSLCTAKALNFVMAIFRQERNNYDMLKEALVRHFTPFSDPQKKVRELLNLKQKQGERLQDHVVNVLSALQKAEMRKDSDIATTIFIDSLLPDLAEAARLIGSKDFDEAVKYASLKEESLELKKQQKNSTFSHIERKYCHICGKENHTSNNCWFKSKDACETCGKSGHSTRNCWNNKSKDQFSWNKSKEQPNQQKEIICWNCQEKGHYSSNCPRRRRDDGRNSNSSSSSSTRSKK